MTLNFSILKADMIKPTPTGTVNVGICSKVLDKHIVSMMGEIDGGTSDIRQGQ